MSSSYALSSLFAPGDRHALVGTKSGKIQMFDISSGDMTEEIAAHDGEVWSLAASPDNRGLVSGSGDKTVKFWDYELVNSQDDSNNKVLSIVHVRSLQLEEGVTCVSLSADGRLVAVGLLDSTVKIFFVDSLKFFLSLYGHKLPVVCMDISSDSTIIATGSADRNMKIWGLDFGDCHKSIFAHDDTLTGLRFINNTHMIFTCGKDGQVKQWDADNFQRILTLKGKILVVQNFKFFTYITEAFKIVDKSWQGNVFGLFQRLFQRPLAKNLEEQTVKIIMFKCYNFPTREQSMLKKNKKKQNNKVRDEVMSSIE